MRWHLDMTKEEIYSALAAEAEETWGRNRLDALDSSLRKAADALWRLMQETLVPLSEEPELLASQDVLDRERDSYGIV